MSKLEYSNPRFTTPIHRNLSKEMVDAYPRDGVLVLGSMFPTIECETLMARSANLVIRFQNNHPRCVGTIYLDV